MRAAMACFASSITELLRYAAAGYAPRHASYAFAAMISALLKAPRSAYRSKAMRMMSGC